VRTGRRDETTLRRIRTLYNLGAVGDLTDGQLLERFANDGDEAAELAFAALVERHEAMVWRVCLAIVRDEHEAEDAFQATFLILVRKARTLWVRDSLGPWLHQVACRTATCLRSTAGRRREHERRCAEASQTGRPVATDAAQAVDAAAIHEEVGRLPEKYRAPIVLCDLEGRTHQEAARSLGWPIGTVKSRQSHARNLIRDRLARRGLGLAFAGAAFESMKQMTLATTPKEISRAAVTAAMRLSARLSTGAEASAQVLALSQHVLRSLLWSKLSVVAVTALAIGIAAGGSGAYLDGAQGPGTLDGPSASRKVSDRAAVAPPDAKLRAQRLATRKARAEFEIARHTRILAEIAVEEYEVVDYPRDLATVEGEIKLAESETARSEDRIAWAARMFDKGYVSRAQKASEELNFQKAKFALEQAQAKRKVLTLFSKDKVIKERKSAVEVARSAEQVKQAAWELEQAREIDLEIQHRLDWGLSPS